MSALALAKVNVMARTASDALFIREVAAAMCIARYASLRPKDVMLPFTYGNGIVKVRLHPDDIAAIYRIQDRLGAKRNAPVAAGAGV